MRQTLEQNTRIANICWMFETLRGRPELSSFSQEYTEYAGRDGGGQWPPFDFLMLIVMNALHFHTGSLKINIFKVLFGREGGGHKKEYSVYAFDNVDNSGRPLKNLFWLPANDNSPSVRPTCSVVSSRWTHTAGRCVWYSTCCPPCHRDHNTRRWRSCPSVPRGFPISPVEARSPSTVIIIIIIMYHTQQAAVCYTVGAARRVTATTTHAVEEVVLPFPEDSRSPQ